MKNILFASLLLLVVGCSQPGFKETQNPQEITTIQIQQNTDTSTCYYWYVDNLNNTFLINSETRLVEKQVPNIKGITSLFAAFSIVAFLLGIIFGLILT